MLVFRQLFTFFTALCLIAYNTNIDKLKKLSKIPEQNYTKHLTLVFYYEKFLYRWAKVLSDI
jgi:hypothetical protein